ncbi:MAG: OmpA family protein [Flavobacteriales bacterium]
MKCLKYTLTLLLLCACVRSFSQGDIPFDKTHFPDKTKLKEALNEIRLGDHYYYLGPLFHSLALEHYQRAAGLNPNNADLNLKMGHCYLNSPTKTKAIPFLEKANKLNPDLDPIVNYYLGRAYQLNMQWDKAVEQYEAYKVLLGAKDRDKLEDVKKKIAECKNGRELMKDTVKVKIENTGQAINSEYPEYGPVISADESVLLFTSRRKNTTGGSKDLSLNVYYEDIYISKRKGEGWGQAKNIGKPVNTEKHDATIALSSDGQTLYVYKDDKGDGNIYSCKLRGTHWSKPEKMPEPINSKYHESSISLSPDGKTAYFVSARPEGSFGGRDIWVCTKEKGNKWGAAKNLGNTVNTRYNEEGVFMHPDGKTLYFSSQGHSSMGGYDIFKTVYDERAGRWSEPENIGYPVNTPDDDLFFVLSASGRHAYYASATVGGYGEKDIYMISFLEPQKKAEPQLTLLKGVITDAVTKKPLLATIEITDNEQNEQVAEFESNSASGKYLVSLPSGKNYGISVTAKGYLFHSENFNIPAATGYQEVEKNVELKKIEVGGSIVLNNIFFDYDKATLRSESTAELNRLLRMMNNMPDLKIEISGHTDNKGSAAYNNALSERRAKAVVDYLVGNGIDSGRLTFKGYGFSKPIASNDTEEGRQLNRRTEFKVVSR